MRPAGSGSRKEQAGKGTVPACMNAGKVTSGETNRWYGGSNNERLL
jgi:hypothetical protein